MVELKYKEDLVNTIYSECYDTFNAKNFYFRVFGELCNFKEYGGTESVKFLKYIQKKYSNIKLLTICGTWDYWIIEEERVMIYKDNRTIMIYWHEETPFVKELSKIAKRYKKKIKGNNIGFILPSSTGFEVKDLDFKELSKETLENNYEIPENIHDSISKEIVENRSGLYIFHGPPGTGKTTYIRLLKGIAKTKKFIFLPIDIAARIADPTFVSLLMEEKNSVLIIEDAEKLLVSRETNSNSVISGILNLTSGLMGECLNIQIICTLNTDLTNIDTALLRKGRLIQSHEFKPLSIVKSQELIDKLGFDHRVSSPMTLADIYNFDKEVKTISKNKTPIGFGKVV